MGQLMGLAWSQDEGHRASEPVGDHARLGAVAATRAAKRLTLISTLAVGAPFFRARRLVVSPNAGAVQKRHPELNPTLLGQEQQPLPHA